MKRKVLLLNQPWFKAELSDLGHPVMTAGFRDEAFDITFEPGADIAHLLSCLPEDFHPDVVVYYDSSGPALLSNLQDCPLPTIFYSVDAQHHVNWHRFFARAFDHVLLAQKDYLPFFEQAEWFPLWANSSLTPVVPKTIDVCFRGALDAKLNSPRVTFFNELEKLVPVDARMGDFRDDYPRSKIVINQTVKQDLNFRVFEAMASGALLLTPEIENGFTELFSAGEDLITFPNNDSEAAAALIKKYLADDAERERIAENGRRKVLAKHCDNQRSARLSEIIQQIELGPRAGCQFGAAVGAMTAAIVYRTLAKELEQHMLRFASDAMIRSALGREENSIDQKNLFLRLCFTLDDSRALKDAFKSAYPDDLFYQLEIGEPEAELLRQGFDSLKNELFVNVVDEHNYPALLEAMSR